MSIPTNTTPTSVFAPTARMTLRASCPAATDLLVQANGTRLRFRPISSDDRDRLARLFARLTPESRYRRFLVPKRELTPRELVYLTDIDHVTHEAIAAVDQRDGSIVGVGRYAQYADRVAVADVAFTVADELQGMGIGTALARCLVDRARANGFTLLTATTLWDNRPARALLRRLRFRARASHRSEIELELELELEPTSDRSRPPSDDLHMTPPRDLTPLSAITPTRLNAHDRTAERTETITHSSPWPSRKRKSRSSAGSRANGSTRQQTATVRVLRASSGRSIS